jgi:hypothetical protein
MPAALATGLKSSGRGVRVCNAPHPHSSDVAMNTIRKGIRLVFMMLPPYLLPLFQSDRIILNGKAVVILPLSSAAC